MNKIFKVVWSKVRNCYVVVSEIAKNTVSGVGKRNRIGKVSLAATLAASVLASGFFMPSEGLAADAVAAIESANPKHYIAIGGAVKTKNPFLDDRNKDIHRDGDQYYIDVQVGDETFRYNYTTVTVNGDKKYYWIREGFGVKAITKTYHPEAGEITVDLYKIPGTDASYNGIAMSGEHVLNDSDVVTAINKTALEQMHYVQYAAVTNSASPTVEWGYQYYVHREGADGKHSYIDVGTTNGGLNNNFYIFKTTGSVDEFNEITGKYQFQGKDVEYDNIYNINGNIGVFLTKSITGASSAASSFELGPGVDVYGGTVFGYHNEILLSGYNNVTKKWSTVWASEVTDQQATIESMTLNEFNEILHHLHEEDIKLANEGIVRSRVTSSSNGGTIDLVNKAGNSVPGISITRSGGSDGSNVSISISDNNNGSISLETGSIVIANENADYDDKPGAKNYLDTLKINGNTYYVKTGGTVGTGGGQKGYYMPIINNGNLTWEWREGDSINETVTYGSLKGADGLNGKSAYEIWVAKEGNVGKSEQDFLDSLKGQDGKSVTVTTSTTGTTSTIVFHDIEGDKHIVIPHGIPGEDAPNIVVGTTKTIGANENANVIGTLSDDRRTLTLDFEIPKGNSVDEVVLVDTINSSRTVVQASDNIIENTGETTPKIFSVEDVSADDAGNKTYEINVADMHVSGVVVTDDNNGVLNGTVTMKDGVTATITGLHDYYTTEANVSNIGDNGAIVHFKRNDNTNEYDLQFVGSGSAIVRTDSNGKVVIDAVDTNTVTNLVAGTNVTFDDDDPAVDAEGNKTYTINATNNYVTSGRVDYETDGDGKLTLYRNGLDAVEIGGFRDTYTKNVAVDGNTVSFSRNDGSTYGVDFTSGGGTASNPVDTYVEIGVGANKITLNTGSIVKANDGAVGTDKGTLTKLAINGEVYSVATSDSVTSAAAKATTVVKQGNNVILGTEVKNGDGEDGHTEYTINAIKTIVNGDSNFVVENSRIDFSNHTITYGLGLANKVTIGDSIGNPIVINGIAGEVTGLQNKTWNPATIISGRAATEDQLKLASIKNGNIAGYTYGTDGNGKNITGTSSITLSNADGTEILTLDGLKDTTLVAGTAMKTTSSSNYENSYEVVDTQGNTVVIDDVASAEKVGVLDARVGNAVFTGTNYANSANSVTQAIVSVDSKVKEVWDDTVVNGTVNYNTGKIELITNDDGTVEVGKLRDYAIKDEDVVVNGDKAILTVKDRYSDASYDVKITGIASTSALESAETQINNQITNITNGSAIKFNTIGSDKLELVNASGSNLSSVTITSQVGTGGLVGVVNGAKDATITFTGTGTNNTPVVVSVGSTVSGTLNNGVLSAIKINGENYGLFTASDQKLSVSGNQHGWTLTDSSDNGVYQDTTLNRATTVKSGDATSGYSFTVEDTAGTSITVNDIASASNLNSLKTVVDGHTINIADLSSSINTINTTVANNCSTLNGNDIRSIVVTPNSGANATGGTVALWRNSTTGTTDTVPGTLTFTSGGGTEVTGDTYVHIAGKGDDGNVQNIMLHTGTKVEANSRDADDSTMTQLTLLTINGKDYFIPEMDVDQNGNAVFQDYHVTNGDDTLYTYKDSDNTDVAVKGYSVNGVNGVVELHVHDRHQNTGSHEGVVRIGNLANKTTQDAHTKQLTGTVMYDAEGEGYNYNSIKLGEAGTSNYSNKTGGVNVTNVAYANGSDGSAAVNVDLLNERIATVTTQATAAKTTLSETGKNITVGKTSNQDGSTNYTVNLKDNITLGDASKTNVNINGTNGSITALTTNDSGTVTGKVEINSSNSTITVGTDSAKQVVINGSTGDIKAGSVQIDGAGTITGLTNKTWNPDQITSGQAATEDQLKAAITTINTNVAAAKTEIRAGSNIILDTEDDATDGHTIYTISAVDNKNQDMAGTGWVDNTNNIQVKVNQTDGTNVTSVAATIQDVAKASNLGDVSQLNADLKQTDNSGAAAIHTNVVQAVNKLDDKVNQGWTTTINGSTTVKNVKMGDTQDFKEGSNIKLSADSGSIVVSTAEQVNFTKVTVGSVVVDSDGINAGGKKITNVDNGDVSATSKDAVNGSQLYATNQAVINNYANIQQLQGNDQYLDSRINQLGSRVNKVGAGAAALAALHPMDFDPDDKLSFAVGAGNYAGENATALGAFYRPNEKVMMSVGGTYGNGENMVNVGMSFALDRTNNVSNSRTAMAKEIVDLREQVATQGQQIAQLVALVQQLAGTTQPIVPAEQLFPDVPQNHWAYEYVNGLIAKGIIEGYPDGTFGGDRAMTRYEFAAMLFRAMEQGVVLNEQVRQEFEPELGRIRVDRVKGADNDSDKIERVRVNKAADRDNYGSKIVQVKH